MSTYLDHAGAAPSSHEMRLWIHEKLRDFDFTNPHSSATSVSHSFTDKLREQILTLLNASSDEYQVVFTMNATHALKCIGEHFPFQHFAYTISNHNSVVGLREYVRKRDGIVDVLHDDFTHCQTIFASHSNLERTSLARTSAKIKLVAYPAECNLTGRLFNLDQIATFHAESPDTFVCLDAAKFITTNTLDLQKVKPDFVPLSLYKLIGYPTGLGALLVHKRTIPFFTKQYFGGGTYDINIPDEFHSVPRENFCQMMEDGTLPYITIAEASIALEEYMKTRDKRIAALQPLLHHTIQSLQTIVHPNGKKVVHLFSSTSHPSLLPSSRGSFSQGSCIAFNIQNAAGEWIGYNDVAIFAQASGIKLRVGCCCNPGACNQILGFTSQDIRAHHKMGFKCWNHRDIIDGKPTGVVRISLGLTSTYEDVTTFVEWIKQTFITYGLPLTELVENETLTPHIVKFVIYPIKSCPGIEATKWIATKIGFKYDRMYAIYDAKGMLVTIQRNPLMGLLKCHITSETSGDQLVISAHNTYEVVTIDLTSATVPLEINQWLTKILKQNVTLVKSNFSSFVNTSAYLVCNRQSIRDLNHRVQQKYTTPVEPIDEERFRPNIVIDGVKAYTEDDMKEITLFSTSVESPNVVSPSVKFISEKICNRCFTTTMIARKQTRDINMEPMKTLLTYRKTSEGSTFGMYMDFTANSDEPEQMISAGPILVE